MLAQPQVARLREADTIGYLKSQRDAMTGERGAHTNRPELVSVRRGEISLTAVLEQTNGYERRLIDLSESASVPDQPDRAWVDDWLHRAHTSYWSRLP